MASGTEIYSSIAQRPMYIPCNLRSLLSTVKTVNVMSTLDEVLDAMKDYIYENTLYDLKDPGIVYCDKNLTGVLNTSTFTLFELKRILLKLILKENTETVRDLRKTYQAAVFKRKSDEIPEEETKRFRMPDLLSNVILDSEESSSTSYKTAEDTVVINNIEDSFSSEISDDDDDENLVDAKILEIEKTYEIEYEINSDCSIDSDVSITDTDSDIEDVLKFAMNNKISVLENEKEFWADQSSNEYCDTESDEELTEADKWRCSECGTVNKPPKRYCLKCWESRKGWLASHYEKYPHMRRKRKNKRKKGPIDIKIDTEPGSSKSFDSSQEEKSDLSSNSQERLCTLCYSKQMNATVVHGKIGHQFSCYKCARHLQSLNQPCPICRRSIERVIHQIVVG